MARKKSSLDMDEPVLVEGEEPIVMEPTAEPDKETVVVKAEPKPAVTEKTKAETQEKKTEIKKKRGVKICVI